MNTTIFQQLYDYHFAENHKTWNWYINDLPQQQFTQKSEYSHGSVRNHLVHLMSVEMPGFLNYEE